MHVNSLEAYTSLTDLGKRQKEIYDLLIRYGTMTDREVLQRMGGYDMNQVRPRITELIEMGWAKENGREKCRITGRHVRTVRAVLEYERQKSKPSQMDLGIRSW